MGINSLYLEPFPTGDTTTSKLRISLKTSGQSPNIYSALFVFQLVTSNLPPIATTSNYMTLYQEGNDDKTGLGIFLKYDAENYYVGVRYIDKQKHNSVWEEVPGSFINLSNYTDDLNNTPFLVFLSYDIASSTTPNITFSIVKFSGENKTGPDFTLNYTFSDTHIESSKKWGFGSVPQTNTNEYGLLTDNGNGYNSYVSAGIYLTYLELWSIYILDTTTNETTYAMFNTLDSSYSIYSILRSYSYIPFGTSNLKFQLVIPTPTLTQSLSLLNNNITDPVTYVTLTPDSSGYSQLPHFAVNGSDDLLSTYIKIVTNEVPCLLKGMKILTETGYKLIEELTENDKILTGDNRLTNIQRIYTSYVYPDDNTLPLIIEPGKYGAIEYIYISKAHKILIDNKFYIADNLNLPQLDIVSLEPIQYYHIQTDDYINDTMIVNGVIVETFTNDLNLSLSLLNK
jgi:hypothetical protein